MDQYVLHEIIERVEAELVEERPLGAILHVMDSFDIDADAVAEAYEAERA
jgi:hypothetical protein